MAMRGERLASYDWRELPQVSLLSQQKYASRDKNYVCRAKIMFVATNICPDKHVFVTTKVLSRQAYFCRDNKKKCFVATKIILVAAPADARTKHVCSQPFT